MTFATLARMIGIKGGIILALLLAFGFVAWRADTFSDRLEQSRNSLAAEKAAHAVTRASLDNLQQRMAVFIADGKRRSQAAQRALERQESHSAALGEQIARIRAERPSSAAAAACETPAAVRRAGDL